MWLEDSAEYWVLMDWILIYAYERIWSSWFESKDIFCRNDYMDVRYCYIVCFKWVF